MQQTSEFQERIGQIEELVAKLDSGGDSAARADAKELVEALMALHGAGLARILDLVSGSRQSGVGMVEELAEDELIGSLLVLYGLHPHDFESRVRRGLDKAGAILRSRGAHFDQIVIGEGTVRLRIAGAESERLEEVVREHLLAAAPDATEISIEAALSKTSGFVPLTSLKAATGASAEVVGKP